MAQNSDKDSLRFGQKANFGSLQFDQNKYLIKIKCMKRRCKGLENLKKSKIHFENLVDLESPEKNIWTQKSVLNLLIHDIPRQKDLLLQGVYILIEVLRFKKLLDRLVETLLHHNPKSKVADFTLFVKQVCTLIYGHFPTNKRISLATLL